MVSVVVLQPFIYRGADMEAGSSIEMEPVHAAIHARAGLVSLLHGSGNTYQTREMVASSSSPFNPIAVSVTDQPQKRKRGRPRKVR